LKNKQNEEGLNAINKNNNDYDDSFGSQDEKPAPVKL
jgi:hypothetical protein